MVTLSVHRIGLPLACAFLLMSLIEMKGREKDGADETALTTIGDRRASVLGE
jgi:hypothetical protein